MPGKPTLDDWLFLASSSVFYQKKGRYQPSRAFPLPELRQHKGYAFLPPMIHDAFRFLPHDRRESDIQSVSPGRYISMQSQNPYAINNDWINLSYEIICSLLQRCRLKTLDRYYYESS